MKNLIIILLASLLSYSVTAQEEALGSGEFGIDGYGAIMLSVGPINGETGIFLSGQGGWMINDRLALGVKGSGLINHVAIKDLPNAKLDFMCWGGLIEYTLASNQLLRLNINSMIGSGAVRFANAGRQNEPGYFKYSEDFFFVVEPGANLDLKIGENVKVGLGLAYRLVSRVEYEHLDNADINGISGQILVKFGIF